MLKTTAILLSEYGTYADPFGKIRRMCQKGELLPLVRGTYETDKNLPGYLLASAIYGPSYLSFEYALSYYGLIPERVCVYTSATYAKGRHKYYKNFFGDYSYRDVPSLVFSWGIRLFQEQGYFCFMAGPEKALCDKLYTLPSVKDVQALEELLFRDLRIYEDGFAKLKKSLFKEFSKKYQSQNINLLVRLCGGE